MKRIQIILALLAFVLATVSCSSTITKRKSSRETTTEQKVIERITFSQRDLNIVHILFEDGSIHGESIGCRHSPSHLAQKGDTVVIKNGEISEIKFVMSK